jgi:hypothetical protein
LGHCEQTDSAPDLPFCTGILQGNKAGLKGRQRRGPQTWIAYQVEGNAGLSHTQSDCWQSIELALALPGPLI